MEGAKPAADGERRKRVQMNGQGTEQKGRERILILSLGVGNVLGKNAGELEEADKMEKLARREEFSYQKVTYTMAGESDFEETEFVAEPIVKVFRPKKVFILGTSKSAWTGFYGKFGDGDYKTIQRLYQIEEPNGKDRETEALKSLSEEVEGYYKKISIQGIFQGIEIHVLMLRYGIEESELMDNYRLLSSSIAAALDKEKSYEIAFDITHSFRYLPFYNLAVLNYLKNVLQVDLEISHIYYGNIDIRHENDNKAPVLDLKELVSLLDITGGISEFENTGNAVSLLQYIPDTEAGLREALKKFDWAMQLNAFDGVEQALGQLISATTRRDEEREKFADLRAMIANVICRKYFQEEDIQEITVEKFRNMDTEKKQYLLCEWYFAQNRYGQAIVTAMETLRSCLVPMLLQDKGKDSEENRQRENYRKEAVDRLRLVSDKILRDKPEEERTEIEQLICSLESARRNVVPVRNVFAHNLIEGGKEEYGEGEAGQNATPQQRIEAFIARLREFRAALQENREKIEELYNKGLVRKKVKAARDASKSARLLIASWDAVIRYENYATSGKGGKRKTFDVYRIDESIAKYWENCVESKDWVNGSIFFARYILGLGFDPERIQVIIHSHSFKMAMHLVTSLQHMGVRNVYWEDQAEQGNGRLQIHPLGFDIRWETHEEWEQGDQEKALMDHDVIKVFPQDGTIRC